MNTGTSRALAALTFLTVLALSSCSDLERPAALTDMPAAGDSLYFSFTADTAGIGNTAKTRSSITPNCNFGNGISMAIYYNGNKVATGSCTGSTTKITMAAWSGFASGKTHDIYAVANASITWPSTKSELETNYSGSEGRITINNMAVSYYPMANHVTWNGSTTPFTINLKSYGCYDAIPISAQKSGVTLVSVNSITTIYDPDVYPFYEGQPDKTSTTTSGMDYLSSTDKNTLKNTTNYVTLYIPSKQGFPDSEKSGGASAMRLNITRRNGGFNYVENYVEYIPNVASDGIDFQIDGSATPTSTTDTRSVTMQHNTSTNKLNVESGTYYSWVNMKASNGDTNFSGTLSWTGVSGCLTSIVYKGTSKSLASSGSFTLTPSSSNQTLTFNSTYTSTTAKTVTLTAKTADNAKSASMNVVIQSSGTKSKKLTFYFIADSDIVGPDGQPDGIGISISWTDGSKTYGTSAEPIVGLEHEYETDPITFPVSTGNERLEFTIYVKAYQEGFGNDIYLEPSFGSADWADNGEHLSSTYDGCTYEGYIEEWDVSNEDITYGIRIGTD